MAEKIDHLREFVGGSYVYETKSVKKTRKSKFCQLCNKLIPVGSSVKLIVFCTTSSGEFHNKSICCDCQYNYKDELDLLIAGKLDDK